jgi:hypothetical protein
MGGNPICRFAFRIEVTKVDSLAVRQGDLNAPSRPRQCGRLEFHFGFDRHGRLISANRQWQDFPRQVSLWISVNNADDRTRSEQVRTIRQTFGYRAFLAS